MPLEFRLFVGPLVSALLMIGIRFFALAIPRHDHPRQTTGEIGEMGALETLPIALLLESVAVGTLVFLTARRDVSRAVPRRRKRI